MDEKVTQEWVLLNIEKSTKNKLDIPTFWRLVCALLVPVIGFLTHWIMKLDDRLDREFLEKRYSVSEFTGQTVRIFCSIPLSGSKSLRAVFGH